MWILIRVNQENFSILADVKRLYKLIFFLETNKNFILLHLHIEYSSKLGLNNLFGNYSFIFIYWIILAFLSLYLALKTVVFYLIEISWIPAHQSEKDSIYIFFRKKRIETLIEFSISKENDWLRSVFQLIYYHDSVFFHFLIRLNDYKLFIKVFLRFYASIRNKGYITQRYIKYFR